MVTDTAYVNSLRTQGGDGKLLQELIVNSNTTSQMQWVTREHMWLSFHVLLQDT